MPSASVQPRGGAGTDGVGSTAQSPPNSPSPTSGGDEHPATIETATARAATAASARVTSVVGHSRSSISVLTDVSIWVQAPPAFAYFTRRRESYFFDFVKDELIKEYGAKTVRLGGLQVRTTIDLKKQQQARAAIAAKLGDIGPKSAIVTINPKNGYIVAMASSAGYGESKFNLAAQGHRQPGSSFKIMTLLTALRLGVDPNSTTYSSKGTMTLDDPPCGSPGSPWRGTT